MTTLDYEREMLSDIEDENNYWKSENEDIEYIMEAQLDEYWEENRQWAIDNGILTLEKKCTTY